LDQQGQAGEAGRVQQEPGLQDDEGDVEDRCAGVLPRVSERPRQQGSRHRGQRLSEEERLLSLFLAPVQFYLCFLSPVRSGWPKGRLTRSSRCTNCPEATTASRSTREASIGAA